MRSLAVVLAIAGSLAGCGGDEPESTFPPTDTGAVTGGFEPGDEVVVVLDSGTAFLTQTEGGTRVDIGGTAESGAIHEGTCEDRGPVAYELTEPTTEVDAELVDLLAGRFALVAGGACAPIVSP
jgi:hypothetical protein